MDYDYDFNSIPEDYLVYNDLFYFNFDDSNISPASQFPGEVKVSQTSSQPETENNPTLWNTQDFDLAHIDPHLIPSKSTTIWENMEAGSFSQLDHSLSIAAQQTDHLSSRSSSQIPALSNDEASRRFSTCTSATDSASENTSTDVPKKKPSGREKRDIIDGEKDEKRKKFLERNRISAQRCRIRKRGKLDQTQERLAYLERDKKRLQAQWVAVKNELDGLTKLVWQHEHCNHSNLAAWFQNQKIYQATDDSEARDTWEDQSWQTIEDLPPQIENDISYSQENCLSTDTGFSVVTQARRRLSFQDSSDVGSEPSSVLGKEKELSSSEDLGVDMGSPAWWQEWLS